MKRRKIEQKSVEKEKQADLYSRHGMEKRRLLPEKGTLAYNAWKKCHYLEIVIRAGDGGRRGTCNEYGVHVYGMTWKAEGV